MGDSSTAAPIFIVGPNRSGTTLLRLLLNAHSEIGVPDELIYFDSFIRGVPIEHWQAPGLSKSEYESFVDHFLTEHCRPLGELDRERLKEDILAGRHDFKRPYELALARWARHHEKTRWGEKTPGNLFYCDVILEMFPEAKFLYLTRDPRGGVASMQNVSFFPDDVVFNALARRKHDVTGRRHFKSEVPPDQRMTIRYEDLVQAPESTTRDICRFLGERFEPAMLQFHEKAGQYMKDDAQNTYNATATRPITEARVDAWTTRLSSRQIATVNRICARTIAEFDYPTTDHALSVFDRAQIGVKTLYWTYQCWRHRDIRHYTVKHPMFARTRHRARSLRRTLADWLPFSSA